MKNLGGFRNQTIGFGLQVGKEILNK